MVAAIVCWDSFFADKDNVERGFLLFFCVMLAGDYEELRARGLPIEQVYARDGMWATSGRALWRRGVPPTRRLGATPRVAARRTIRSSAATSSSTKQF